MSQVLYNVAYEDSKGRIGYYLSFPVTRKEALPQLRLFRSRYVGKMFPNGCGFYDYRNARLVEIRT